MNPIAEWWVQCLQNNTWWPKTRNNIVHKDTFMNHFITYLETFDLADDRPATSRQIFWEGFYQIQPIASRDKIIRRIIVREDGLSIREPHIRLPNWDVCVARMTSIR
jgi:hypothetical protein